MSAPVTFDPAAYIVDMHKAGAVLVPFVDTDGRRLFAITPGPSGGIPGRVLAVGNGWAYAAHAHPDWVGAVHDALVDQAVLA